MAATATTVGLQSTFPTTQHSEAALIESARAGNTEAFAELVMACKARLYKKALELTRNTHDAEDAVQDAILSAFRHVKEFRAESCFSTWIVSITRNAALISLRGKKKYVSIELPEWETSNGMVMSPRRREVPDTQATAFQVMERDEKRAFVEKAIQRLPSSQRMIVYYRYIFGMTTRETAVHLGLSESAVKSTLHRACSRLKQRYLAREAKLRDHQ